MKPRFRGELEQAETVARNAQRGRRVESTAHESIVSLMNLTEPSTKAAFAPPGCLLETAPMNARQRPSPYSSFTLPWGLIG